MFFEIANVQTFTAPLIPGARVVYIGRSNSYLQLSRSPLANPFPISKGCTRSQSIENFHFWLREQISTKKPAVLAELAEIKQWAEIKGVVLLCWCHPRPCHASVIINFIEQGWGA